MSISHSRTQKLYRSGRPKKQSRRPTPSRRTLSANEKWLLFEHFIFGSLYTRTGYKIVRARARFATKVFDNSFRCIDFDTLQVSFFDEFRNLVLNRPITESNILMVNKATIDRHWLERNLVFRHECKNSQLRRNLRHINRVGEPRLTVSGLVSYVVINTHVVLLTHIFISRRKILSASGGIHVYMRCLPPSWGQGTTAKSCPAGAVTPSRLASHRTMTQPTNPNNPTEQPTQRWPSADDVALIGSDVEEQ